MQYTFAGEINCKHMAFPNKSTRQYMDICKNNCKLLETEFKVEIQEKGRWTQMVVNDVEFMLYSKENIE
jgi:hypothetical protein